MLRLLLRIFLIASALLVITNSIEGIEIRGFGTAFIVAFLLAIVNVTLKPLLHLITFPFILLTFGLFTFVVNGFLFWVLALMVPGFSISSFWAAVLVSLLLSFFSWGIQRILP